MTMFNGETQTLKGDNHESKNNVSKIERCHIGGARVYLSTVDANTKTHRFNVIRSGWTW